MPSGLLDGAVAHSGQNGPVTTSADDRARIAARYPSRPGAHRAWVAVGVVLALLLGGWMVWAGIKGSTKPVEADVHGFTVRSDTEADVTLRVQRRHPQQAAVCTVEATAQNFVKVGEKDVTVAPGTQQITLVDASLRTVNRATTVTVASCRNA